MRKLEVSKRGPDGKWSDKDAGTFLHTQRMNALIRQAFPGKDITMVRGDGYTWFTGDDATGSIASLYVCVLYRCDEQFVLDHVRDELAITADHVKQYGRRLW